MTQASPTVAPGLSLRGSSARRRRERTVRVVFMGAALLTFVISFFIIETVIVEAISFLSKIDLSQLLGIGWFPRRGIFDIPTLLLGSLIVTLIAMLIATPVGLASAIYLSEYATPRVRRTVKPILEILAGIPSIVIGFFALTVITPGLIQTVFADASGYNLAAAGIGVGILSVPLVASVAEDAMRAVPVNLREASYGLGARRITTSVRVVFPAAISGIVAALILATSRAIGETMVVALAAGAPQARTVNPLDAGGTMTSAMVTLAAGSDQVTGDNAAFQSLFFIGLLLFVITLVLNLIADAFVRRTRQRY
ncbi:MAG TPA: phosphate ABC transporter permease subunit PstC [Candidatus Limnocylindrales bacterium]|nr:phosphate ABC transporter permease subunit PstC [Candidatus Limnocylindrales bacterium]